MTQERQVPDIETPEEPAPAGEPVRPDEPVPPAPKREDDEGGSPPKPEGAPEPEEGDG